MTRTEPVDTVPVAREWSMNYTMLHGSVRLARIHVRRHLTAMRWRGDVEDAALIVSELVSNAINHGRIPEHLLTLRVAVLEDGGLFIDVSDPVGGFPRFTELSCPPGDVESGRGLPLVHGLGASLSWFLRHGDGKTVRARL
ncbi:ATP-binding protein [Streptomyces sp. NPDC102274]|uniref:ATP-binding protein n=1 Tax=Streptomyces sp. NPDC102274 TaxID=3366151 RepID=UPI0037FD11E2